MGRFITLVLLALLASLSLGGMFILSVKINQGQLKIQSGEKQLAEGEQLLQAGKAKLAAGRSKMQPVNQVYNVIDHIPIVSSVAKTLPVSNLAFSEAQHLVDQGNQMIAQGAARVQAGEQQLSEGRAELARGIKQLALAKQIRVAFLVSAIVFMGLFIMLAYRWRHFYAPLSKKRKL